MSAYQPFEGLYSSYSSSVSSSPSESRTAPVPTFGLKQKCVPAWKPTNHRFRRVCNYRSDLLAETRQIVDDKAYTSTRRRVQYLLVVMGDYKFSGADPIRVISFLARCKDNFDNANMTEEMALMALPHLLSPRAEEVYESQKSLLRKS